MKLSLWEELSAVMTEEDFNKIIPDETDPFDPIMQDFIQRPEPPEKEEKAINQAF